MKSPVPSSSIQVLIEVSSLEESSLVAAISPWSENNLLKVADGLTGTVVIGGAPLGQGILGISLNGGHASLDDL